MMEMETSDYKQIKNHYRRQRLKEDEKIIESMLMELKEKNEIERQSKIQELEQQLKNMRS